MTVIAGLGPVGGTRPPARAKGAPGFQVAEEGQAAERLAQAGGVCMPSLLAMQEAESGAAQDRDARRHGQAMLAALAALQRELLGGEQGDGLEALAGLVRAMPAAADPALAGVQRALLVRVAVELARRRAAASL